MKIKTKEIRRILIIAAAALIFMLFSNKVRADEMQTAADNVYVENVNISGMNEEQINNVIADKMNSLMQGVITINVGAQSVDVTAGELGLYQTNTDVVSKIMEIGKKGSIWKRYKIANHIDEKQGEIFELRLGVDEETVRNVVETKCAALNIERRDMTLEMQSDGSIVPTDKVDGLYVDVDNTTAAICEYMNTDWHGGYGKINAVTVVDEAYGDADNFALVKDVLGQGVTYYTVDDKSESRVQNIAVGTSKINGAVIYPGEEFSAEEYLTPFTAEAGYVEAGTYLNGEVVDDFGGGICQVTSTLYRAVLESELDVTERCEHSLTVGYVDPSMDASVAEGIKDFKFVNDTDAPIYIEGYAAGGTVQFTIFGHETRDPARTISFESKVLTETDIETRVELDPTLDFGKVEASQGHKGMTAVAYKIVYMNGEQVSKEQINSSEYKKSDQVYTVGTKGATAAQISQLQAAADKTDLGSINSIIGVENAAA